jgi:cell volume regulation protein A
VPVVLATIPVTESLQGGRRIFDLVVVLVVVFTIVQSPALAPLARRLRLAPAEHSRDLDVEAAPLDTIAADLLTLHVSSRSRLHGVEVWELRLPETAAVAFVVRDAHGMVPGPRTTLRHGDDLLVITSRSERDQVERRLRAVGRSGRLAGFFGDDGDS